MNQAPIDRPFGFRLLVAAGGYRTGSTLQYNLIGTYLERIDVGRRVGLVDPDDLDELKARFVDDGRILVAKSHHATGEMHSFARPNAWADEMQSGMARALSTSREVGAVRRSMCRKFGLTEDTLELSDLWRVDRANARRWKELGAHEQTYELLTAWPVQAIKDACCALDLPWSRSDATVAARDSSIDIALGMMNKLAPGEYHPVSLVHWDHVDTLGRSRDRLPG